MGLNRSSSDSSIRNCQGRRRRSAYSNGFGSDMEDARIREGSKILIDCDYDGREIVLNVRRDLCFLNIR